MSSIEEAFAICGYCFRPIPEDEEGLMSGAVIETAEGSQPSDFEGEAVEVWRGDDHVLGVVPDRDSEAAEDGTNLLFLVCSEECAEGMEIFLRQPLPIELRPRPHTESS